VSQLKTIVPAYPFVQYRDDPNIVAFFTAYNTLAQSYLDQLNTFKLPYWPSSGFTGNLLDWVVFGVYGQTRPELQVSNEEFFEGPYDTQEYNTSIYNQLSDYTPGNSSYVPDEYWKRILTWNFYKADGQQFSIPWLKRRIARFLYGTNGRDPRLENTYDVSVTVENGVFNIRYPDVDNGTGTFLRDAIEQGMVYLPFQYTYNVFVTNPDG